MGVMDLPAPAEFSTFSSGTLTRRFEFVEIVEFLLNRDRWFDWGYRLLRVIGILRDFGYSSEVPESSIFDRHRVLDKHSQINNYQQEESTIPPIPRKPSSSFYTPTISPQIPQATIPPNQPRY